MCMTLQSNLARKGFKFVFSQISSKNKNVNMDKIADECIFYNRALHTWLVGDSKLLS